MNRSCYYVTLLILGLIFVMCQPTENVLADTRTQNQIPPEVPSLPFTLEFNLQAPNNSGLNISNTVGQSDYPCIVDGVDNFHFLWRDSITASNNQNEIYYRSLGGSLINLANSSQPNLHPHLAIDENGHLHAVWQYKETVASEPDIVYRKSTDGGVSWSSTMVIAGSSPRYNFQPSLSVDSTGMVHFVWVSWDGSTYQIYYRTLADSILSSVQVISNNSSNYWGQYPRIALDSLDNPHVVWWNVQRVQASSFTVGEAFYTTKTGSSWSSPLQLSDGTNRSVLPVIDVDELDNIHTAWHVNMTGTAVADGDIVYRHKPVEGTWEDIRLVDDTGTAHVTISLQARGDGDVQLVWFNRFLGLLHGQRLGIIWRYLDLGVPFGGVAGSQCQLTLTELGEAHVVYPADTPADIYYTPVLNFSVLLPEMVLSDESDCRSSQVSTAQPSQMGINPYSGGVSEHIDTGLDIPVAGGSLSADLTYNSSSLTNNQVFAPLNMVNGSLPDGWTHNYLAHLDIFTDTVEFQDPKGNRLSFSLINGSYIPYAGVTANLVVTGTPSIYTLTCAQQHEMDFDEQGRQIAQRDPHGNEIVLSYDGNGRLATVSQSARSLTYGYDGNGRLSTITDHTGRVASLGYDGSGHLTQVSNPLQLTTTLTYSNSYLTQVTDPTGRIVRQITYDAQNRAIQQQDGEGNQLLQIQYPMSSTRVITLATGVMTYTYDSRNTLVQVTHACTDPTAGCQASQTYQYDYHFRTTELLDGNSNPADLIWSNEGTTVRQIENAETETVTYTYDDFNNLIEMQDARGFTTQHQYDDINLPSFRTATIDALGYTTLYTPTINGQIGAIQDVNGRVTEYTYNDYNQLIVKESGVGTSSAMLTTYAYDNAGRLIVTTRHNSLASITDRNFYDDGDRLIGTLKNWSGLSLKTACNPTINLPDDKDQCTRYHYDDAGRVISQTNALGQTDLTFYDDAGRVTMQVENYDGLQSVATLCTDFSQPDPEYNLCTLMSYDEFGRPISQIDSLGRQTVTQYNTLGRVSQQIVNYQDGVYSPSQPDQDIVTQYQYDAVGNTTIVTDTLGRMTLTEYDMLNRMVGMIENWQGTSYTIADCASLPPNRDTNICTQYAYDEMGNTIIITNTLGQMSHHFYDPLNRLIATVDNWNPNTLTSPQDCNGSADENICTQYGYDPVGNQITTTNALDQTTLTNYDAQNRPVLTVQNWQGSPLTFATCLMLPNTRDTDVCQASEYDALGRLITRTDALGNETQFVYDGLGRPITTTRFLAGQPVHTTTAYDRLGNVREQADANEQVTQYTYDSLNRQQTTTTPTGQLFTTTYDASGRVLTVTNGLGETISYQYDQLDRLIQQANGEGDITSYEYDGVGNQTAMVDANNIRTEYIYDDLNRLVQVIEYANGEMVTTQYLYDALGNRLLTIDARGIQKEHLIYDDLNRSIRVMDALSNTYKTAYNALGQTVVMTDALRQETHYLYDGLNREQQITYLTDGQTVTYTYDVMGNRLRMQDAVGTTTYAYDDFYRLISQTNPYSGTILYVYDAVGNRTSITYPDGKLATYTYDPDNRLIQVTDWDGDSTQYAYDLAGRLVTTTMPYVVTVQEYDRAGRVTAVTHRTPSNAPIAQFSYQLDGVGNRIQAVEQMATPCQSQTQTQISQSGNDIVLTWSTQATTTALHRTTQPYLMPDDTTHLSTTSMTSYSDTGAATLLTPYFYTVRAVCGSGQVEPTLTQKGKFTFTITPGSGTQAMSRHIKQTPHNDIEMPFSIEAVQAQATSVTTITYQYDPLYRLTEAAYTGTITNSYQYQYDAVGNMVAFTDTLPTHTRIVQRQFDDRNALDTSTELGVGTSTYYYTPNGNLEAIDKPNGIFPVYAYDQRNQILNLVVYEGVTTTHVVTYTYDGDGNRVQQITADDILTYHNDTTGLANVLQTDGSNSQTSQLYGRGLISQGSGNQKRTLLTDGLGSVRLEMVGQAIAGIRSYEPFGTRIQESSPTGTVYGFTGESYDTAPNLLYLRARYYSPELRLFLSSDPLPGSLRLPATQHPYAYVHNNPVNLTDPSGSCIFFGIDTLICIGAGLGFVFNVGLQTWQNMENGMSFWDAIYKDNLDWVSVTASTVAGGISGALTPFIPAGTSLTSVLAYGTLDGFIGGVVEQLVFNSLISCRSLGDDVLLTGLASGLAGGVTAGIFDAYGHQIMKMLRASGSAPTPQRHFVGYHGTSSTYLDSIREGIHPISGSNFRGRAQLGEGLYLSDDPFAARWFAAVAADKNNGLPIVLEVYAEGFDKMTGRVVTDSSEWWEKLPLSYIENYDMLVAPIDDFEKWWQVKLNPSTYENLSVEIFEDLSILD